jgi:predicted DNA-binding transcriptional regulator YafY
MRASRLLAILLTLQNKGRRTAEQLAQQFEISVRTVYRDIDHLSAAGIPVYADRGPNGGFALLDGYRTRLDGLDLREAEAVLLSAVPEALRDLGLGGDVSSARQKLVAALPGPARSKAAIIADRFHVDPLDWYRQSHVVPHLPDVANAVWHGLQLDVTYQSWKGVVQRTISPMGLVMKAGTWYLVAQVKQQTRIFKISGIIALTMGEQFARDEPFDLARFWKAHCEHFERSLIQDHAVVMVTPAGLEQLDMLGAYAANAARKSAGPVEADGRCRVTVPIESPEHAARQLFGFGSELEVISPTSLRDLIEDSIRAIALRYHADR